MRLLLLLVLLLPTTARAAERKLFVSSFERIRVEGPFQVTVATGRSPAGSVTGDPRRLDAVEVRLDGTTLVVRPVIGRFEDQPRGADAAPVTVALATPVLVSAAVIGGGAVAIAGGPGGIKTTRLDLSVTGAGSIALTGADVDAANAQVIGEGRVTLAGRAARARLMLNGAGRIDADKLDASELVVRVDGPGETTARARYSATVTNTGLGRVAIAGTPKCVVKSGAGGPVTCGVARKQ